jgi:hypothetical protein
MFKEVKNVVLIFENCDTAKIDIKHISNWYIGKVHKHYSCCNVTQGDERDGAEWIYVIFKDLKPLQYKNWNDEYVSLYKRVTNHSDITGISIEYKDGTEYDCGVPWGSNDQFFNAFQIVSKTKYGQYEIEIKNKWTVKRIVRYSIYLIKNIKWKIKRLLHLTPFI